MPPPPPPSNAVATVTVSLAKSTITIGETTVATATARSASGAEVQGHSTVWGVGNTAIATINQSGQLTGVGTGTTSVTATVDGIAGSSAVTVTPVSVASVTVTPTNLNLSVGGHATLTAVPKDAAGNALQNRAITWSVTPTTIVSVSQQGSVTALAPGSATVTATVEGKAGSASVTVASGPATQLSLARNAAGAIRGRAFTTQPIVEVHDANGFRVAGDNSSVVRMTVSAGGSSVGTTVVTAVQGAASFTNVGIDGTAGASYSLTFSSGTLAPTTQSIRIDPYSFATGTHVVGAEIVPGLYRSNNQPGAFCYWERLSGFGGTTGEIIANDITGGPAVVAIAAMDRGFSSSGCAPWSEVIGPVTVSKTADFNEGTFIVGVDIAPGTWRAAGIGQSCYWARLSGFGGTFPEIIANDFTDPPVVVTISASDAGFLSSGCGPWKLQ